MWSHCVFDIAAWQQGVIPSFNLEILGFGGLGWLTTRPFVFNWSQKIAEILLKVLKSIVNRFSSANNLKTARMIGKRRWIYKTIQPCSAERSSSSSTHMIYDWSELVATLTSFFVCFCCFVLFCFVFYWTAIHLGIRATFAMKSSPRWIKKGHVFFFFFPWRLICLTSCRWAYFRGVAYMLSGFQYKLRERQKIAFPNLPKLRTPRRKIFKRIPLYQR